MPAKSKAAAPKASSANLGVEAKLWLTTDKLRNNMDSAEPERSGDSQPQAARRASEARQYKHVVPGLSFLKYISDTFEEHRAKLLAVMNLALRGIEAYFGPEHAGTFRRNLHPDLRAEASVKRALDGRVW